TLQQARGLQWLVAEPNSLKLTQAPRETTTEAAVVQLPPAPPPDVLFSAPTADESDVPPGASVRIQFSRDMDPATFRGRVKVTRTDAGAGGTPVEFTTRYL